MENNKTQLCGIKAICHACNQLELPSSQASVMAMILQEDLPAKKLGGIWISDFEMITAWRRERIMARPEMLLQERDEDRDQGPGVRGQEKSLKKKYVISKKK